MTDTEPEHKKGTQGTHFNKLLIRDKLWINFFFGSNLFFRLIPTFWEILFNFMKNREILGISKVIQGHFNRYFLSGRQNWPKCYKILENLAILAVFRGRNLLKSHIMKDSWLINWKMNQNEFKNESFDENFLKSNF